MGFDATKKRIIRARNASHKAWGPHENNVDRVTAFSLSSVGRARLGEMLWRLKYSGETGWRDLVRPCVSLLERQFRDPDDRRRPRILLAIIACALTEWIHDQCPECGGRGKKGAGREIALTTRQICKGCRGRRRVLYRAGEQLAMTGAIVGNEIPDVKLERVCPDCGGAGGTTTTRNRYSRLRDCSPCHTTGRRQMDDKRRAIEIGMPLKTWVKWKPIYVKVLRELRASDDELAMRVDFRLGRAENPDPDVVPGEVEEEQQSPQAPALEVTGSSTTGTSAP